MKKTVISTKVGGVGMLIKNGYNGYLINVGDAVSLANHMKELVDDKEKISLMGQNLYVDVEANFSTKVMAEKHIRIYEEILSKWR